MYWKRLCYTTTNLSGSNPKNANSFGKWIGSTESIYMLQLQTYIRGIKTRRIAGVCGGGKAIQFYAFEHFLLKRKLARPFLQRMRKKKAAHGAPRAIHTLFVARNKYISSKEPTRG